MPPDSRPQSLPSVAGLPAPIHVATLEPASQAPTATLVSHLAAELPRKRTALSTEAWPGVPPRCRIPVSPFVVEMNPERRPPGLRR